jgi:hypothetical protein
LARFLKGGGSGGLLELCEVTRETYHYVLFVEAFIDRNFALHLLPGTHTV